MTLPNGPSRSLAEMVGANCRRIRTELGYTQDELAAYARAYGLKWNAAKVANFEAGRWEFTLATVLLVGMALERALVSARIAPRAIGARVIPRSRAITLADLLTSDDDVLIALNDDVLITAANLAGIAHRQPFPTQHYEDKVLDRSGLAEQRLAKTLGISGPRLADVSFQLWDSTFSEERDRRAGVSANQQKRGRISRELRAELEKALANGG